MGALPTVSSHRGCGVLGLGAFGSPVCLSPRCRKSQWRRARQRATVSPWPRGIVSVQYGEGGGRFVSKVCPGATRTRINPFHLHGVFQSGRVPPSLVCVLDTLSRSSGPGQEVWPDVCVCVHAVNMRPMAMEGPPANNGHRSSVAAFSSIGRTSKGQGTSSRWQTLVSPGRPLSPLLCSKPDNDSHRNSPVPKSLTRISHVPLYDVHFAIFSHL